MCDRDHVIQADSAPSASRNNTAQARQVVERDAELGDIGAGIPPGPVWFYASARQDVGWYCFSVTFVRKLQRQFGKIAKLRTSKADILFRIST